MSYKGLQRLQGITKGYRGLQGITGGYKGLQGVRGGFKELQEDITWSPIPITIHCFTVTFSNSYLQGAFSFISDFVLVKWGYKGLQGV